MPLMRFPASPDTKGLSAEPFKERRLWDEDFLLGQSNFVGLTNLQYPVEINAFDFHLSKRLRFALCVFGVIRADVPNPTLRK